MTESLRVSDDSGGYAAAISHVVESAKAGDHSAFEQLMIWHQHKVVSTAWRMLGNQEDARDAAQEVFMRVYKYLRTFRTGEDFSGWLYRIIINVCRDTHRRRGPLDRMSSFEAEVELGGFDRLSDTNDVEASAMRSQERTIIANALNTLSKKEREAIVLRDLEGLSTEEVARILGSSQTTVRSQISSARTKIKEYRDMVLSRRRRDL
jgi:RNA polymerase sigma-70 factor (ECF subfamily)